MVKVIIIGSGNVAQHLIVASKSQTAEAEIKLVQVFLGERIP
jgi:malate/lactate dehydrogenase